MIDRHVTFDVAPGKEAEFETFVKDQYRPAMSTVPGFFKLDLLREIEAPIHYKMVIGFETQEAAKDWRTHKSMLRSNRSSRSFT